MPTVHELAVLAHEHIALAGSLGLAATDLWTALPPCSDLLRRMVWTKLKQSTTVELRGTADGYSEEGAVAVASHSLRMKALGVFDQQAVAGDCLAVLEAIGAVKWKGVTIPELRTSITVSGNLNYLTDRLIALSLVVAHKLDQNRFNTYFLKQFDPFSRVSVDKDVATIAAYMRAEDVRQVDLDACISHCKLTFSDIERLRRHLDNLWFSGTSRLECRSSTFVDGATMVVLHDRREDLSLKRDDRIVSRSATSGISRELTLMGHIHQIIQASQVGHGVSVAEIVQELNLPYKRTFSLVKVMVEKHGYEHILESVEKRKQFRILPKHDHLGVKLELSDVLHGASNTSQSTVVAPSSPSTTTTTGGGARQDFSTPAKKLGAGNSKTATPSMSTAKRTKKDQERRSTVLDIIDKFRVIPVHRLYNLLKNSEADKYNVTVDRKTLRRLVKVLEAENLIQTVAISVPCKAVTELQHYSYVVHHSLTEDEANVLIQKELDQRASGGGLGVSQQPDEALDAQDTKVTPKKTRRKSVYSEAYKKFKRKVEFQKRFMSRVRVFHEAIWAHVAPKPAVEGGPEDPPRDWLFELKKVVEDMPVADFLRIFPITASISTPDIEQLYTAREGNLTVKQSRELVSAKSLLNANVSRLTQYLRALGVVMMSKEENDTSTSIHYKFRLEPIASASKWVPKSLLKNPVAEKEAKRVFDVDGLVKIDQYYTAMQELVLGAIANTDCSPFLEEYPWLNEVYWAKVAENDNVPWNMSARKPRKRKSSSAMGTSSKRSKTKSSRSNAANDPAVPKVTWTPQMNKLLLADYIGGKKGDPLSIAGLVALHPNVTREACENRLRELFAWETPNNRTFTKYQVQGVREDLVQRRLLHALLLLRLNKEDWDKAKRKEKLQNAFLHIDPKELGRALGKLATKGWISRNAALEDQQADTNTDSATVTTWMVDDDIALTQKFVDRLEKCSRQHDIDLSKPLGHALLGCCRGVKTPDAQPVFDPRQICARCLHLVVSKLGSKEVEIGAAFEFSKGSDGAQRLHHPPIIPLTHLQEYEPERFQVEMKFDRLPSLDPRGDDVPPYGLDAEYYDTDYRLKKCTCNIPSAHLRGIENVIKQFGQEGCSHNDIMTHNETPKDLQTKADVDRVLHCLVAHNRSLFSIPIHDSVKYFVASNTKNEAWMVYRSTFPSTTVMRSWMEFNGRVNLKVYRAYCYAVICATMVKPGLLEEELAGSLYPCMVSADVRSIVDRLVEGKVLGVLPSYQRDKTKTRNLFGELVDAPATDRGSTTNRSLVVLRHGFWGDCS